MNEFTNELIKCPSTEMFYAASFMNICEQMEIMAKMTQEVLHGMYFNLVLLQCYSVMSALCLA